jgi:GntR family transcriptional regulator/MocR family aminotransferase
MEPDVFASLVRIDPDSADTRVIQLYRAIRDAVIGGRLTSGEALPSSRQAADLLGLGRNTVNAAYELLVAEGVIEVRPGSRPRVGQVSRAAPGRTVPAARLSTRAKRAGHALRRGLSEGKLAPGSPDPALFPSDAWGRMLRRAARHRQDGADGYAHYGGLPELREVLADQLHRHRGLVARPEDIVVTPGTQASLVLAAAAFADSGDTAMVESPGYLAARTAFEAAGLICRPLPVDGEGADAAQVDFEGVKLVYVTPSTQYPTGVRMPLSRRIALAQAAQAAGAVIVEDDYDSEFVWEGRGIAAMAAMPRAGHIIYLGSAAKSLLPGLRIGWLVAPEGLADGVRALQTRLGLAANLHAQAALADFMGTGAYRAHISSISRTYHERLEVLADAVVARLGSRVQLTLPAGGLQVVIDLPGVEDNALRAQLNSQGYAVASLSDHCFGGARTGLVIGFGSANVRDARRFADLLTGHLDAPAPS